MKSKSLTPERLERIKQIITEQEELATYHGITQATCLNCGKVTKDISKLEMMNDLDPTCATCETHLVAWFCNDGRLVVTGETEDGEEIREEIIKENK